MTSTVPLLIGGDARHSAAFFERHDPVDNALATRSAAATIADANDAVDAAEAALPAWRARGGSAWHRTLERAYYSGSTRDCRPTRLRQHGDIESVRSVPTDSLLDHR